MRFPRKPTTYVGFGLILGALFLLAFKQVTKVFNDPRRTEFQGTISDTIADPTYVILSSLLLAVGLLVLTASISPARGWERALALLVLGLSSASLLVLHLTLYINSVTIGTERDLLVRFTAGYLFHTSPLYTLIAVFLLFLVTVGLLCLFVSSMGFLLSPRRFTRALWDGRDWAKNEANVLTSSLLLVVTLAMFLVYLLKVAVRYDLEGPREGGFLAQNLGLFYYVQAGTVGLFLLTVAARTFLVNWGSGIPLDRITIRESLDNVGRVERVLLGAALLLNLIILSAPTATDHLDLSRDPVFLLDSRGLAWFFFLLGIPYVPYAASLHRLRRLLGHGGSFAQPPFSPRTLRLVLIHLGGVALLVAMGLGGRWSPLGLMIALGGWTAGVFLAASVEPRVTEGLLDPRFRGTDSPPLFFAFLVMALATGLMLWGAGNTFEASYQESTKSLVIENESSFGIDLFARVAAAALLSFSILLALRMAQNSRGGGRPLVAPNIVSFLSLVVLGTVVFTVDVWSAGNAGLEDVLAGFAFHQFYGQEKAIVGLLVLGLSGILFWSLGHLVSRVLPPTAARAPVPGRLAW